MKNSNLLTIKILNKSGYVFDRVTPTKASSYVRQHRCAWVDSSTLQLLIDSKDEKRMKEEVWAESGYVCYICDKQMDRQHPELTIDHITPKRWGGSLLKQNMACCCKTCNEDKGCRTLADYIAGLMTQVAFMLQWYRVPLSRYVVRRDRKDVQQVWRHGSHSQKEEKESKRPATSGKASGGSHSQSLDLLDQRLLSEAGGIG